MRRISAIAWLTWKAAFRYRLFWVMLVLLIAAVVALPVLIKDDGTARGFTQILLTYTLSSITGLLGFATLWLACGTLARDIEESQMQMVAVKPIARWQIWIGKWLGILLLDAALLIISGSCVYALLMWRANKLPPDQQHVLRTEIFVARGAMREPIPDYGPDLEKIVEARLKQGALSPLDLQVFRTQVTEQLKARDQLVPPNTLRRWQIDFGLRQALLKDEPLFIRFKFIPAQTNIANLYLARWVVGPPDSPTQRTDDRTWSGETFHEIPVPPNMFDKDGKLTVEFWNRDQTAVLFPIEDGLEILYRESGFAMNFARGMSIIFFWLALLAAVGLCSASFLSFPVAAFFSIAVLFVGTSGGTLAHVIEEGTVLGSDHETGAPTNKSLDLVLMPVFRGMHYIVGVVQNFSPVDALSSGRSIPWERVGAAFGQIVLLAGGVVALIGIVILTRRELATAQSNN